MYLLIDHGCLRVSGRSCLDGNWHAVRSRAAVRVPQQLPDVIFIFAGRSRCAVGRGRPQAGPELGLDGSARDVDDLAAVEGEASGAGIAGGSIVGRKEANWAKNRAAGVVDDVEGVVGGAVHVVS